MIVYHYDASGAFLGTSEAAESPLEPGVFLIPARATNVAPPSAPDGSYVRFDGQAWVVALVPVEPEPPAPAPEPEPLPVTSVTMRQARLALLESGKLDLVAPAIDQLSEPDRTKARIEWEFAQDVRKDWPLIQALAPSIGLDAAALTALFNRAATL